MVEKQILDSWKEIAAYLKRSVTTCKRLEHERGLPVHRLEESPKARVFAYKQEIDRWIETTQHSEQKSFLGKLGRKRFLIPAYIGISIAIIAVVFWKLVPQAQAKYGRVEMLKRAKEYQQDADEHSNEQKVHYKAFLRPHGRPMIRQHYRDKEYCDPANQQYPELVRGV